MSQDYAAVLKQAMNAHIGNKYGHAVPPPPFITPFGIKTLDALLGGGVPTSAPICITSTPETGKSTLSLQFAATFLRTHPDGVVLYVNIEEAAGGDSDTTVANVTYMQNSDALHPVGYHDIEERIKTFGIDPARFLNKPVELNVKEVFELIMEMITIKRNVQQRTNKEVKLLIIWDSVAATPSSKDAEADNPNEIIGFKARELTLGLSKLKQAVSMERCAFIIIDQVRANMKIESRFQAAVNEKSVGDFGNFKAATAVSALQHHLRQWLFFSKGAQLKPSDPLGVDGWILNVFTEKNKLAPSQYSIPLIFDKKFGAIPFFSEYHFMSEITKTEKKFWKEDSKIIYPLCIKSSANSKILTVYDPDNSKNVLYQSPKVMERNIINLYRENQEFHYWFDRAVDISVDQRIKVALFRNDPAAEFRGNVEETPAIISSSPTEIVPEPTIASMFDINVENIKSSQTEELANPFAIPDIGEYEPLSSTTSGRIEDY